MDDSTAGLSHSRIVQLITEQFLIASARRKVTIQVIRCADESKVGKRLGKISKLPSTAGRFQIDISRYTEEEIEEIALLLEKQTILKVSQQDNNCFLITTLNYKGTSSSGPIRLSSYTTSGGKLKAPFTFFRTEKSRSFDVSVAFFGQFSPTPAYPEPSVISKTENGVIYTWKTKADPSGTLCIGGKKVHMIWWEGTRSGTVAGKNNQMSVCVSREQFAETLKKILVASKILEREYAPFIQYWKESIDRNYPNASHIKITPIPQEIQKNYLPELRVQSATDGTTLKVQREYFLFEPTGGEGESSSEHDKEAFFRSVEKDGPIIENLAVDLGGEFTNSSLSLPQPERSDEKEFNREFINAHINA